MLRVLARIMKKEFIQTLRDKRMVAILMIAPVFQTLIFGFAINLDLTAQPVVVADLDRSPESRELLEAIAATDGFRFVAHVDSADEAERMVVLGRAVLALLIPEGFARDKARGGAQAMVVLDGSDSNTALRAGQEISQILVAKVYAEVRGDLSAALRANGLAPERFASQIVFAPRAWFNPRLRSAVFFVPGVLGLVLTVITMMLTSMGLTREKEIGTLEQIMVTPVRPWQLILGKTIPFALLGLVDMTFIVSLAAMIFDIPTMGPLWALMGAALLFFLTTLGMGLFISTVSATQQQAMMNAFFVLMPAIMLSGFVFPIENMPQPVQWLTTVNPLRYFIAIVRGVMVKGASLADLWDSALKLGAIGLAVISLASLRFRKRLT
ncbi:MAG: ABC transporter permease [Myxococcales bacterium]|nr:MAG: ABC transporter permease [Myxococcales bacterium]